MLYNFQILNKLYAHKKYLKSSVCQEIQRDDSGGNLTILEENNFTVSIFFPYLV